VNVRDRGTLECVDENIEPQESAPSSPDMLNGTTQEHAHTSASPPQVLNLHLLSPATSQIFAPLLRAISAPSPDTFISLGLLSRLGYQSMLNEVSGDYHALIEEGRRLAREQPAAWQEGSDAEVEADSNMQVASNICFD
jgi:hypothetical protein